MEWEEARNGDLTSLRALVGPHLRALEEYLREEAEQFEPEIRDLVRYCVTAGGKRIRATLVFLGGWVDPPEVREDLVRLAAVVELVHLATLVHDDILDSATTRHSRMTAARKYGASTAVLLGDAIFAQAVNLSTRFPDSEVCRQVSLATRRVCVGEIAQTLRRDPEELDLRTYYRIVDLKTAELFSVSCLLGARLAGYGDDFVQAVAGFGRHLGVAYQIYDDLVDFFGQEEKTGKTLGTDLRSGKMTLPILLLREKLGPVELIALDEGGQEEQIGRRAAQMLDRGVYAEVVEAVLKEANAAKEKLAPFGEESPTRHLLKVHDRLKAQVAALQTAERHP